MESKTCSLTARKGKYYLKSMMVLYGFTQFLRSLGGSAAGQLHKMLFSLFQLINHSFFLVKLFFFDTGYWYFDLYFLMQQYLRIHAAQRLDSFEVRNKFSFYFPYTWLLKGEKEFPAYQETKRVYKSRYKPTPSYLHCIPLPKVRNCDWQPYASHSI